jgi:4'-phosphopantetheinyl transferase
VTGGRARAADDTLLWLLDTGPLSDAALDGCAAWLGQDERRRCGRFVRPERRRQFIAGRVLLRLALGRLLGLPPRDIVLRERPGNAPALDTPAPAAPGFSISHSGPWVACAASTVSRLGLDIERTDPGRDLLALAGQAFGPGAVAQLGMLEEADRVRAFYRMWCLHEAHIKLGAPGGADFADYADYAYEVPGLAICLSAAQPLAAAPDLMVAGPDALDILS